jgi:hypothetical protein
MNVVWRSRSIFSMLTTPEHTTDIHCSFFSYCALYLAYRACQQEVDVSEFLQFFELQRTRFSKRVFSVMDADGSGEMDFSKSLKIYCNSAKSIELHYTFLLTHHLFMSPSSATVQQPNSSWRCGIIARSTNIR